MQQRKQYRSLLYGARIRMVTGINEFDRDSKLFNCRNVTVEFGKTIKTHPHTPDDLITKVANCDYDPQRQLCGLAKAPRAHLRRIRRGHTVLSGMCRVCGGWRQTKTVSYRYRSDQNGQEHDNQRG
ncbi:MAG: hypothetical protein ACLTYW_00925 [Collinsella sp.]